MLKFIIGIVIGLFCGCVVYFHSFVISFAQGHSGIMMFFVISAIIGLIIFRLRLQSQLNKEQREKLKRYMNEHVG